MGRNMNVISNPHWYQSATARPFSTVRVELTPVRL